MQKWWYQYQKNISESLTIIIKIHLPRHDHHPEIEDGIDEFECKGCFPTVTYSKSVYKYLEKTKRGILTKRILHQPSHGINIIPS